MDPRRDRAAIYSLKTAVDRRSSGDDAETWPESEGMGNCRRRGMASGHGFLAGAGELSDSRFGPLKDIGRMHQPRWLVEHGSNKLESELLEDSLRGAIIGMVPGIDLREPRFMPSIFERAARRFGCEALAPARLYEMKADLEIRLCWRVDPRSQATAADEPAIAVIE